VFQVTTQLALILDDRDLAVLDTEVENGHALDRAAAVLQLINGLRMRQRYERDNEILDGLAAKGEDPYPDLTGLATLPSLVVD
jgi:hypothetical protein